MNIAIRNSALRHFLVETAGHDVPKLRKMTCCAGEVWTAAADGGVIEAWFPERGSWVLEQRVASHHVEVALLQAEFSPVVPVQADLRVRALVDGVAYAMPLADLMAVSPDLLPQYQPGLLGQMARWAWCVQHHAPVQRLAGCLLWMHRACADASGWPVSAMPGARRLLPAQWAHTVRELERAQAARLVGGTLQVLDQEALQRQACTCHTAVTTL